MFSFSKTPRFFRLKQDEKVDKFYNLPSTLGKRSAAMGFGKKYFFKPKNISEFISIKRYFDKNYQPGFKYSFGISRDKFSKVYYPGRQIIDMDIPGPGKYNLQGRPGIDSPRYTMRPKCLKKIISHPLSPGPGDYSSVINFNSEGRYPLSNIANTKTISFGKNSAPRIFYRINDVPGPGTYKIKGLFGSNFNSKYNSGRLISIHKKLDTKKSNYDYTPGPGTYSSFSEFGMPTWESIKKRKSKKIRKQILSANGFDNSKSNIESTKTNKM
jgi:hypothetical protein